MILYKETKKLYQGKYQHRIVLVCSGVHVFRGNNLDNAFVKLSKLETFDRWARPHSVVHSADELNYLFKIYECLRGLNDYAVRVETPWLSIYTNNESDIITLKNIDKNRVREVYRPFVNINAGEVVSSLPYDYKVTIKSKSVDQNSFVEWAQTFDTIRLTDSCVEVLSNNVQWPNETYFYVKGDKTLTMAKLHLGGLIKKVERIISRDTTV